MARLKIIGFPPTPAPGDLWCAVCAALAKGSLLAPQWEALEAALADDTRDEVPVGVDPVKVKPLLNVAVTVAPAPALLGAVVPVCWLHAPAVDGDSPPPPDQAPPPARPGLIVPPGRSTRGGM